MYKATHARYVGGHRHVKNLVLGRLHFGQILSCRGRPGYQGRNSNVQECACYCGFGAVLMTKGQHGKQKKNKNLKISAVGCQGLPKVLLHRELVAPDKGEEVPKEIRIHMSSLFRFERTGDEIRSRLPSAPDALCASDVGCRSLVRPSFGRNLSSELMLNGRKQTSKPWRRRLERYEKRTKNPNPNSYRYCHK